jgi:hypothetical protein
LQAWSLGANGRIEAVSRQDNGVGWKRKKFVVDGLNDGREVATL